MIRSTVQYEAADRFGELAEVAGRTRRVKCGPFDEFFALNYARTVRLARLLSGSSAVAEDLAQDAFARIHDRFAELDNPAGYLHVVTVNGWRTMVLTGAGFSGAELVAIAESLRPVSATEWEDMVSARGTARLPCATVDYSPTTACTPGESTTPG